MIELDPSFRDSLAISTALLTRAVSQRRSMAAPTIPAAIGVEDRTAVHLAFARRVLGDVGEPQDIGRIHGLVALDQVLFGGLVHPVLLVFLRSGQALYAQLADDEQDQLLVDHHVLFTHEGL